MPENNKHNQNTTIPEKPDKGKTHWHPAFVQAIQADLAPWHDILTFTPEMSLTVEPLRIDLMIIKKTANIVIENSIARFFRRDNLLEYKSPSDYLSIEDYAQVHAYANQYAAMETRKTKMAGFDPLANITLTFIANRHPRKFLEYLEKTHERTIERPAHGIYLAQKKHLPIQVIAAKELSGEENIFLRTLKKNLSQESLTAILDEREKLEQAVSLDAYFNTIIQENPNAWIEVQNMARRAATFEEVFTEAGIIPRWIEQGRAEGLKKGRAEERTAIARSALDEGFPLHVVQKITGLDMETIKNLQAK